MATPKRKPKRPTRAPVALGAPRDVPFAQLRALIGKPLDDSSVKAALARAGTLYVPEQSRGQLIVAREAGFDLLLEPRDGKRGAPLLVEALVCYREGVATSGCPQRSRGHYLHRQFKDLPFGLAFVTRRELLARMPPPRETWLWGTGAVAVDAPLVSYDEWILDGFTVSVDYTESVPVPASGTDAVARSISLGRD